MKRQLLALVFVLFAVPAMAQTSPNGTQVPPATQLVDTQGSVWTIDGTMLMVNGAQAGNGTGSILCLSSGVVNTLGTDNNWYQWVGSWSPLASPPAECVGGVVPTAPLPSSEVSLTLPVPTSTYLAFDHDGMNTDGYRLYVDGGAATALLITAVNGHWETTFPALTPGPHTLIVRAFNTAGESPDSNVLAVRVVVTIPTAVSNLRIVVQ